MWGIDKLVGENVEEGKRDQRYLWSFIFSAQADVVPASQRLKEVQNQWWVKYGRKKKGHFNVRNNAKCRVSAHKYQCLFSVFGTFRNNTFSFKTTVTSLGYKLLLKSIEENE